MGFNLFDHQIDAIKRMQNGCILCGGVGSGKSRTAIAYYYKENGGDIYGDNYTPMNDPPKDLYIITTAQKRDKCEWEGDLTPFLLSTHDDVNIYSNKIIIDSWNNILKYKDVTNAFFIFDEQRLVGKGVWVKTFLKIAKTNDWILLSATPGDKWEDYMPVFVANGFYKNMTEFKREHLIYSSYTSYPMVDRYVNTGRLLRLRNKILVDMPFNKTAVSHHIDISVDYDIDTYKGVIKDRWNPYTNIPIENASELSYTLRKVINSSYDRQTKILELVSLHPRSIIFYNFDYELDILKSMFSCEGCNGDGSCGCYLGGDCPSDLQIAEWNGHKHQPVPDNSRWVYLVQYTAGCEGWNCIKTDTIIFFSQNYSYRVMIQASGRIDRLNTPYRDLYYYHLKSKSSIDMQIARALKDKKKFNESRFVKSLWG